ncbi:MAG: hypothetical protein AAGC93_08630 [Cyanobacteria bacterium P01_F01_bin.53]
MTQSEEQQPSVIQPQDVMAALVGYRQLVAPQDSGKHSGFSQPVSVYMGGQNNTWQLFYQDKTATTAGVQKLSADQLNFMKWVTEKSAQNPGQEDPLHKQNGNLRIDVGTETVFTMANGYVRYNALKDNLQGKEHSHIQPGGGWPNAPSGKVKKQKTTVEPVDLVTGSTPANTTIEITNTASSSATAPTPKNQTVTHHQPVMTGKGLSSSTLGRYLEQIENQVIEPTATDFAKSRVGHTRWQTTQYERASNQNKRILAVAHTLLKQYGEAQGGQLVYRAEGYLLEADARTIRIYAQGTDNKALFEAKKSLGNQYKVKTNRLNPDQHLDFNKVQFLLDNVGVEGINIDPRLRLQQLEALAPQGDKAMAQDLSGHALAKTAERFLNHLKVQPNPEGVRELRGQYYTITQKGETLKISARERGLILHVGPKVSNNSITPKDIAYFKSLAQRHLPRTNVKARPGRGR